MMPDSLAKYRAPVPVSSVIERTSPNQGEVASVRSGRQDSSQLLEADDPAAHDPETIRPLIDDAAYSTMFPPGAELGRDSSAQRFPC